MERFPIPDRKRRRLEALIRIFDIIVYAVICLGGIGAGWDTPTSVERELVGWEWLVPIWVSFLIVGGLLGAIGRVTRIWVLEPPAAVAAIAGIAIYFVVLGRSLFESPIATLATGLVFVAGMMMARRYVELQIFGSDPDNHSFSDRIVDALRRRTADVAPREE